MHILFWVPPWPVNGDLNFFRNSTAKHIILQANALAPLVSEVTIVLPEQLMDLSAGIDNNINVVTIPIDVCMENPFGEGCVYQNLYAETDVDVIQKISSYYQTILPSNLDAILLWETPVPFLKKLFSDCLIINQMPGVFSRPPYPHTVVFDPTGLYKQGSTHLFANEIQRGIGLKEEDYTLECNFKQASEEAMYCFKTVSRAVLQKTSSFNKLSLLPLQVSSHYAFVKDTTFKHQVEMLWYTLRNTPKDNAILTTQYRSGLVNDTPLNEKLADAIQNEYNNLIYDQSLEKIDSVSQYFVPHVDEVISASSSLGLQGMLYRKEFRALGDTFLGKYSKNEKSFSDISWADRCKNTVATILSRHQPLASKVTKDGTFLLGLITEMLDRKKSGKIGLELLPAFREIFPDYDELLLSEFRVARAANLLSVSTPMGKETDLLRKFTRRANDHTTKVITFDVFDTLIRRPVEKPADLYRFLDRKALELTDGVASDFGKSRALCETETRSKLKNVKTEITLDDIYDTLSDFYGVDVEVFEDLKEAEISLEISKASSNPFGKKLFEIAKLTGKPVHLISDMYLPAKVIKAMLKKSGYCDTAYDNFFLSCDHNKTKHSGELFDEVLDTLGVKPTELLHIGDNKHTDINMAESRGINTFRWASAIELMRSNPEYKKIYSPRVGAGEKARSAVAGTSAYGLFNSPLPDSHMKSLSGGDPFRLGYAVLGPLLTGYMMWLEREAKRDEKTDLYFMSREGWVLKEVYDQLFDSGLNTHYLLGSRRAVRVAGCYSRSDVISLVNAPYNPNVPLINLLQSRFGLKFNADDLSLFEKLELKTSAHLLDRSFSNKRLLISACDLFMDRILKNAEKERKAYNQYIESTGLLEAHNVGIVDVGWKANIQGALGNLINKRVTGYYYATLQDSEIWHAKGDTHRAYLGESLSGPISMYSVPANRHLVEFLLCHFSRSLVCMKSIDGQISPQYRQEKNFLVRQPLIRAFQHGAIKYAQDFRNNFNDQFDEIFIDPTLAEAALASFVNEPKSEDAKLFVGQSFEDAVGGIDEKYIISHTKSNWSRRSIWNSGAEAIYGSRSTKTKSKNIDKKRNLEKRLVKSLVSERKYAKYMRDRERFFMDSKSLLMQKYFELSKR